MHGSSLINWKLYGRFDDMIVHSSSTNRTATMSLIYSRCYSNSSSSCSSSSSSFSSGPMYFHQCSKCQSMISANELVMRTDEKHIYHIDCFTCCLCNVALKPGDDYGLDGSLLFCRLHSEHTTNTTFSLCSPIKSSTSITNVSTKKSRQNSTGTTTQRKQRTKLNNLENNANNLEMTGD